MEAEEPSSYAIKTELPNARGFSGVTVPALWAFVVSNPASEQHRAPECIKMEGMQLFDRITWNPNQMNGQPCIRGMRLTVRRVVEAVAIYPNRDDLFRNYPELEPEDVRQALAFAAASLEDSAAESNAA